MVSSTYSKNVLIIGGPTASGKSQLALDLAGFLDGVIINGDSQQIYTGLPILSAQPSDQDLTAIPHKLYGILSPQEKCTASKWQALALAEIQNALDNKKFPIIVGGTGLYLKALYEGLHSIPTIATDVRHQVLSITHENLHQELEKFDPLMAQRLHPNDTQRLCRALEIIMATGRSQAEWITEQKQTLPDLNFFKILVLPDKELNKNWAWERTQKMFNNGVIEEVQNFCDIYKTNQNQTLGFQTIVEHLKGSKTLEDTITEVHIKTRQYIKRQRTWFAHQYPCDFLLEVPTNGKVNQQILTQIKSYFPL